ncbi:cuticle protein AMP1A-like [Contarinia nasturtii]|uniref:cuticle protein AMP1A-like n=1 Tax=Contarinia nasturtii TaxID=265458 RepID=UPI0012D38766|nr:cuticle protein AMP1A-like [Contarinia nasturtii]
MMKAIVLVAFAAVANCALLPHQAHHGAFAKTFAPKPTYHNGPVQSGPDASAQVLRSDSTVNTDSFQYAYETSNGIQGQEQGQLKQIGPESAIVSQGQFAWTAPDGTPIQISFIADENGYQPTGSILPVGPPTPAHVLRLVEYLKTHAPQQQESFGAHVQPSFGARVQPSFGGRAQPSFGFSG